MENVITEGIGSLFTAGSTGLTVSVLFNLWFIWRDHHRDQRQIELQKADIENQLKLTQVLETLKNEKALMQRLDGIKASQE